MPRPPMFCVQLHWLEIRDVVRVEKHIAHGRRGAVRPEGMARQDNAFSDNSSRVWIEKRAGRDERGCCYAQVNKGSVS